VSTPDWKDVLPIPPPGGRLHEAWMTSFEQPDAGLLVEHLLPSLLGASHSLSQEIPERTLFFGELGTALEQLHGRITVISSPPRVAREPSQYPWLWRYVSHFRVGAAARAVQHAKLWAFHWKVGDEEQLDLHVSSTNLTPSAYKAQVQAGWQASVRLSERTTVSSRRTWGELVPFLEALGASAGAVATARLERLITLLGRAECPAEVTFVASIPGNKSAARQLRQFEPSEIHVLTPTIGEWNGRTVEAWSTDVGVVPGKLHLKWIATSHPWAETSGWALSDAAGKALEASGVQVECLPTEARFTELHRETDPRWSHAKLYLLRSLRKRRLLVTSANWSVAAWGAGKTAPRNFELGVVFDSEWTDLESIGDQFDPPDTVPFYVDRADEDERASILEWAEATWDGKLVQLLARSLDSATSITAVVNFSEGAEVPVPLVGAAGALPWKDPDHTPLVARFTQGSETLEVDVLDLRRPTEFSNTPLPEVDPALAKALREAFLLQRYGGPIVDADSIPGLGAARRLVGAALPTDYSVQAWLDTRAAFGVVDSWRAARDEAKAEPLMLERVRLDGEELRALYARREGPAAGLVVEELRWRIDEEA
jgi:hypothetical protein